MARICPLFSGSAGNSTLIAYGDTGLLIDAGVSYKALANGLECAGFSPEHVRAVFITHEHGDHIKGLKTFLKRHPVPVYAGIETLNALIKMDVFPAGAKVIAMENGGTTVSDAEVIRFETSHDVPGSSGFRFNLPGTAGIGICTDTGTVTPGARKALQGADCVLLESNHDIQMLQNGPYPPQLKMRILSDKGHLSNMACSQLLGELLQTGTTRFILGHLSEKNNTPLLAFSTAKTGLLGVGAEIDRDYLLTVAGPKENGVTAL